MNISAFFIRRPVATVLMSLGITLAGLTAYGMLPVSPLPQVDFPTIFISASLPGASPKTMAASVATPLERAVGRIAGVTELTSSSSLGNTRMIVQFDLSRDINGAARDVQAAINASLSDLPPGMPSNPWYRKVNPADAPVMIMALTSDALPIHELFDAASTVLAQKISQMPGIGQVTVGGGSFPAVRVELNPDMLHSYAVSLEDVRTVIRNATVNAPKGVLEDAGHHWIVGGSSQLLQASEYGPLIIAWRNNAPVRLRDVAAVSDSVQDIRNSGLANGKPAVLLMVFREPGANIITAVDNITAALPFLKASVPEAVDLHVMMDRTTMIRASLADVKFTLWLSIMLVIVVVFVFLRSARATCIPSVAVPVSLIGAFAGMYLCGYSLDNLSLMALAIATGFVVDDAIVVLENISRHMEAGLPAMEAAIIGAKEVSFTVISISLSLIAVFIPILFMGGMVGRLFREFAVTLSMAIMISLLLSLTLTPMMCAYLLRHGGRRDEQSDREQGAARPGRQPRGRFVPVFGLLRFLFLHLGSSYSGMQRLYHSTLDVVLAHPRLTMLFWAATVALNMYMYVAIPKGFFPIQDTGRITGSVRADQSISFQAMKEKQAVLMEAVMSDPAVENVAGFYGGGQSTSVFASLKPSSKRDATAEQIIGRLRQKLAGEPGARLFMQSDQDLRMGGRSARASTQYTLQADDLDALRIWAERMTEAMDGSSIMTDVNNDQEDRGLQSSLIIDRDTAYRMGINIRQIDSALNNAFGQRQIAVMYKDRNQYRVVMEADRKYWQGPEGLRHIWVPARGASATGVPARTPTPLAPLGAFARYEPTQAPVRVQHQGQSAAATISFNLTPDASLSDAAAEVEAIKRDLGVPPTIQGSFQGTARLFQDSLSSQPWLILAALVSLYIVLGVLYESYIHPVTILSTLPSAGVGALLALRLVGMEFSVIAFIGILLLAGIVKKNAILLIDFAIDAERGGMTPSESIRKACLLRFRPIMMTTMAALLGAVPLAVGFGDGGELRRPLGVSIVGGLLMSQLLTLYTTPVIYLYLGRFQAWRRERKHKPAQAPALPA